MKPAVTVSQLGDGTIWTHIAAGHSFLGQPVELQKQVRHELDDGLEGHTERNVEHHVPGAVAAGTETVRVAFSVNQAGAGFLGANSNPLLFHAQLVTLLPTAQKVLYGNRVALSGRITSHQAGQIVTILACKYGHSSPEKATIVLTRNGRLLEHERQADDPHHLPGALEREPEHQVGGRPLSRQLLSAS